jgi:hypothetical protein
MKSTSGIFKPRSTGSIVPRLLNFMKKMIQVFFFQSLILPRKNIKKRS